MVHISKSHLFHWYISEPKMLFHLPIELRLKIYELVFGTCPCRNPHAFYTTKHQIALNILLINRQIYAETRVLGFQLHKFDFHRWCGTGVHACRIFLQRLCQWQLYSIQRLSLRAVESNFINGSSSCRPTSEWIDICAILGGAVGPNRTGLQELCLTIEGQLIECGLKLLDTEAEWVKIGLGRLKSLQRLDLIIASNTIHIGAAANFKYTLADTLREVQIVIKVVVWGSKISL